MTSQYQSAVLSDTPYVYWRMNQTSGTTLTDSSGNGRNGTLSGTGITYSKTGATTDNDTALGFDGSTGDATSTVDTSSWSVLSVELWAQQPTGGMSGANFAVATQHAQNGKGWAVGFNSTLGSMFFEFGIGSSYNYFGPSDTFSANTWYHIVVTYDGSNVKTYINNVLKTTTAQTGALQAGDAGVWLAAATDQGGLFKGNLDEVAIYNAVLSATRINAHYQAATAPAVMATLTGAGKLTVNGVATSHTPVGHFVGSGTLIANATVLGRSAATSSQYQNAVLNDVPYAYWRMNDPAGTTLTDSSGNSRNGTINGSGVTYLQAGATTDSDTALGFDGSAGKATSAVDTSSWSALTVEFWINQPTGGQAFSQFVVSTQFAQNNKGWGVGFNASLGAYFFAFGTGSAYNYFGSSDTFSANTWYHIAVKYDGANVKTFINGVLKSTTAQTGALQAGDAGVWIAKASDQSTYFKGMIDEVAIYTTAVSDAHILVHYQTGAYYQGVAALSGMALFGAQAAAVKNIVVHLTGAGTVTATAKVLLRPGVLQGSGTLSAAATTYKSGVAALTGSGQLTASQGLYTLLTLYATEAFATTVPTAVALTTTGGGASNSTQRTTIGTATGWGELHAHTYGSSWPAAGSMPTTLGVGLLFDSPSLEGQRFVGGSWTPHIKLDCNVGSVVATIVAQALVYHGWNNTYTILGASTLTAQTINTVTTSYSLPALVLPYENFGVGDKVYFAYFLNITSNSSGSGTASIGWHDFAHNSTLGISTNSWSLPGYQNAMLQPVANPLALPYALPGVHVGGPYMVANGTRLSYNGKVLSTLYGGTFYLNTEGGSPLWRTNIQSLLLSISQTFSAANLVILRPTDEWGSPTSGLNWDDPTVWTNLDYLIQQAYLAGQWILMDISGWKTILSANGQNIIDATFWLPFITAVANHLKFVPNIAWYSIVGEPGAPTDAPSAATLTAFYSTVTAALAAADPNHLISAGGFLHMNGGLQSPPWWKAIWQLPTVTICAFKTYSQNDLNNFASYAQYALSLGKPVENNEFGEPQYQGDLVWNAAGGGFNSLQLSRHDFFLQVFSQGQANGVDSLVFWNYDHGNTGLTVSGSTYDVDASSSPYLWQLITQTAAAAPARFVPAAHITLTIAPATVLGLADSLAKHVLDMQAFVARPATALVTGQLTTLGRIAALNDYSQVTALLDGFETSLLAETAFLASFVSYTKILDCYAAACMALDEATNGLNVYLVTNSLQVIPAFFDAFNRFQVTLGNGAQEINASQSGSTRPPIY